MSYVGVLSKPYICAGTMENGKEQMIILVNTGTEDMTDVITFNSKEYNIGKNYDVLGYGSMW
jgi:hypothetical protein